MRTVTVKKDELLKTLKENRKDHKADYEAAWEGWREEVTKQFEKRLQEAKKAKRGADLRLYVDLVQPEDHTNDYNTAIAMCEWSVDDEIELQHHEFEQYILDDWGWKAQVSSTNLRYTGSASPSKAAKGRKR